jgi:hypothetical protein
MWKRVAKTAAVAERIIRRPLKYRVEHEKQVLDLECLSRSTVSLRK